MKNNYLKFITVSSLCVLLSNCIVGPTYQIPSSPRINGYTVKPLPAKTASAKSQIGASQSFIQGKDVPGQWWELFHSPALNDLIQRGIAHSPTLDSAKAALAQAKEILYQNIGNYLFPAVNGQLGTVRQQISGISYAGSAATSIFSIYNTQLNVAYTLDPSGAALRKVEQLGMQIDYQQFQYEAAYLTLTTNIASTAILIASYQEQIRVTQEMIQVQTKLLGIMQQQFSLGGVSGSDILSQTTQLEQTKASLPPLQKNLNQQMDAMAVLVGVAPSDSCLPKLRLKQFTLPTALPVSIPARLVRERPDVRSQEALLHAACANIGVAEGLMYPKISIGMAEGWTSTTLLELINRNSNIWNIGFQLVQPIFTAGANLSARRQAVDAYQQAFAQYKLTVLQALQNVADTLQAIYVDANALQYQQRAASAAKGNLKISSDQYRLGGVSFITLLNAEQQYLKTRIDLINAEAARLTDTVVLFQALGGGWWHRVHFKEVPWAGLLPPTANRKQEG